MSELIDHAGEQRESEQLNQVVLQDYLLSKNIISDRIAEIKQFSGGASNLTYLITTSTQELILRRPPFGYKAKTAHDMGREVTVLSALCQKLSFCPSPVHYCEDDEVMGSSFYLMERIKGIIIRQDIPKELNTDKTIHRKMCEEFVRCLVEIHSVNPDDVGLEDFGKPQGYVQRQIEGWITRLEKSSTSGLRKYDHLAAWLRTHRPADHSQPAIIHNDYKFDNVIWSEEGFSSGKPKIIGVLDWEMATLGDPLMDLGTVLAYWIQADDHQALVQTRMMPTHLPGMYSRQELAEAYVSDRGWPPQDLNYYRIFGIFRLAVIVQQIYYRYEKGQSDNPKFAPFGELTNLLITSACKGASLE